MRLMSPAEGELAARAPPFGLSENHVPLLRLFEQQSPPFFSAFPIEDKNPAL